MRAKINPELGVAIQAALDAKGWKQRDLANELNIYQQTVSKWIRGETKPRVGDLGRLERLLDLPIGTLLVVGYVDEPGEDDDTIPPGDRPSDEMSVMRQLFSVREQLKAVKKDLSDLLAIVDQLDTRPSGSEGRAAHN